jgi:hypothetical protein
MVRSRCSWALLLPASAPWALASSSIAALLGGGLFQLLSGHQVAQDWTTARRPAPARVPLRWSSHRRAGRQQNARQPAGVLAVQENANGQPTAAFMSDKASTPSAVPAARPGKPRPNRIGARSQVYLTTWRMLLGVSAGLPPLLLVFGTR